MEISPENINLIVAYLAGIITFFASCLLPLVPTYLAYLSGLAHHSQTSQKHKDHTKLYLFMNTVLFVSGFILIFFIFGLASAQVGNKLALYRPFLNKAAGVFFILAGLFLLKAFKNVSFYKEFRFDIFSHHTRWHKLNSFLLGLAFGFAWSPCIGPILGIIIYMASQAQTALKGGLLMIAFGTGLATPFLLLGLVFDFIWPKLKKLQKYSNYLNNFAGIVLILFGILLFVGKFGYFTHQLTTFLHFETLTL